MSEPFSTESRSTAAIAHRALPGHRFLRTAFSFTGPSQKLEAKNSLPPLVNFEAEDAIFVTSILKKISPDGRLYVGISRVENIEASDSGVASAAYGMTGDGIKITDRYIYIYGKIGNDPSRKNELIRKLVHEVSHHAFDPDSHVEERIAEGTNLSTEGKELFGTIANAEKISSNMRILAFQAIELNSYVNYYQQSFGHAYLAQLGLVNILAGEVGGLRSTVADIKAKVANGTVSEEEKIKLPEFEAEYSKQKKALEDAKSLMLQALHLVIIEGWTSIMELAFLNPKGLKEKDESNKRKWNSGGHNTDTFGHKDPYVSIVTSAEEALMTVYKTDKNGLEKIRTGVRDLITPIKNS